MQYRIEYHELLGEGNTFEQAICSLLKQNMLRNAPYKFDSSRNLMVFKQIPSVRYERINV